MALSVYGNSVVSQNRNVFLYHLQKVADQYWYVDIDFQNGFLRLKSMLNTNYALNIYLGSSNKNNCDIHTWADNLEDSKINFLTVDRDNNIYYIQNYRNNTGNNLYLTAASMNSGNNVYWAARSDAAHQKWMLIEVPSGGSTGGNYQWPTDSHRITNPYSESHRGIDIGGVTQGVAGDPIYAFCDGKVKRVFAWTPSQGTSGNASMGNCVFIQSNNPDSSIGGAYLRTIYMHMQNTPLVSVGQYVTKGQVIGYMGSTGYSTAPHLHFAMQANNGDMNPESGTDRYVDRDWVNPTNYLK